MHALATPVIGEGLFRVLKTRRARPGLRRLAYFAVFLCLTTHALLDALTIYGTQLFWPVWKEPIALGSMFIIDPAYTLPCWPSLCGRFSSAAGHGATAGR